MRYLCVLALPLAVLLLSGCGESGPKTASVSGQVTLDGQPMSDGEIHFEEKGKPPPAILEIKGGSYSGDVPLGPKVVRIYRYEEKPPPETATEPGNVRENVLPLKYNFSSTMKANVTDGGDNKFDFKVTSTE